MGLLHKKPNPDDGEEMTDEELAKLVADKVVSHPDFTGALSQMRPDQPWQPEKVDPELKAQHEADLVHDNNDTVVHPPDTVDAAGRTKARADHEAAQMQTDEENDQTYAKRMLSGSEQAAGAEAQPKDAFGRTKDEADQEAAKKVLEHLQAQDAAKGKDEGGGTKAGFISRALGAIFKNANGQGGGQGGAEGGSGSDNSGDHPDQMRGGSVGKKIDLYPAQESYSTAGGPGTFPNSAAMGNLAKQPSAVNPGGAGGGGGSDGGNGASAATPETGLPPTGDNALTVLGSAAGSLVGGGPNVSPAQTAPTAQPDTGNLTGGMMGGGARASFSGGGYMAKTPMDQIETDPALKSAADLQVQGLQHAAEVASAREAAIGKVMDATGKEQDRQNLQAQHKQEAIQASANRMMQNYNDASAVLNNPAKTPDPERYWKNHSKAMFAIGVGLLAQSGHDINGVLANVSSAIDRDIEEQKQTFEAPRKSARDQMAASSQAYGMFREMGHDSFEASKLAGALLKERTATEIAKIAAMSDSDVVKANSQVAQGQVLQAAAKDAQDAKNHNIAEATARFTATSTDAYHRAEVANTRTELAIKANEAGQKGADLASSEARKLADAVTGATELIQSGKVFDNNALSNKLSTLWPTGTTEAGRFDRARPEYTRILMSLLSPAERQNETMVKNVEKMVPNSGDLDGKVRWNETVIPFITKRVDAEAEALKGKNKGVQVDKITAPLKSATTPKTGGIRMPDGSIQYPSD